MKKTNLVVIGFAVFFLMANVSYAQGPGESQHGDKWQKGKIFKELNLTPEQQKKLEVNRGAQREEMKKLHSTLKEKRTQLQEILNTPTVTKEAVAPVANEIKSLQAQLIDHRINGIFAVKEILTPEQFSKFQQMAGNHREDIKGRFEKRRNSRSE